MSKISKKYQKKNTMTLEQFGRSMCEPILLRVLFFVIVCLGSADLIVA